MKPSIVFVTGNAKKLEEVRAILQGSVDVISRKIDLPELQGEPDEVARNKCLIAAAKVNGPVIVEDTSLHFQALGGLPGVYIKWFLQKLGHDGLNKMLAAYDDKRIYAQCTFAYAESPNDEPKLFVGQTNGLLVPARGPAAFGWDPVFEVEGHTQTYAEMSAEVKNSLSHRAKALKKLSAHLSL